MSLDHCRKIASKFSEVDCAREAKEIRRLLRDKTSQLTENARLRLHESVLIVYERQVVIARENRDRCSIQAQLLRMQAENERPS